MSTALSIPANPAGAIRRFAGASRACVALLLLAACLLALTAAPSLAAQGHAFAKTIGEPCPSEPCEGAKLKEPDGVAVNLSEATATSGDVYVVDRGANRVVRFDTEGVFQSEFRGPNATGTGTLTGGSSTVTEAFATAGAFTVGEEVTGAGIPAGTRITAVPGGGVLELDSPVEGSGSTLGVELKASQSLKEPTLAAVDNSVSEEDPSKGDVYVVDAGHRAVDKYTAEGEFITQFTGFGPGRPFLNDRPGIGVAVDGTGRLWVSARHEPDSGVGVFDDARVNALTSLFFQINTSRTPDEGFALDAAEAFYIHYTFFTEETVAKYAGGSSGGVVEPVWEKSLVSAPLGLGVEPAGAGDLFVSAGGGVVERLASADGHVVESFGAGHLTGGGGVAVDRAGSVFVSDSAAGVVDVFGLELPGAPTVQSQGVSNVSASSATFQAALNMRGDAGSYRFEYGRCGSVKACAAAGYEKSVPVPDGALPGDFLVHDVSAHVQGLTAGSVYHFQVVAVNTIGSAPVQEGVFTTQGSGGGVVLADGRRWEMVSPADKHGALVEPIGNLQLPQAAVDGRAFSFLTDAPTESQPAGNSNLVQVLAGRGPSGWQTTDIAGAHDVATGDSFGGPEFRFFSEDLSFGITQPVGGFTPGLSPQSSEQTPYLRAGYLHGNVNEPCVAAVASCYTPLVTGCPAEGTPCPQVVAEHADVPAGTVFGEQQFCPPEGTHSNCGPEFVGASPDARHIVLISNTPLQEGASGAGLYEYAAGRLALVSVLPGPGHVPAGGEPTLGWHSALARGAVSEDGARVFWTEFGAVNHLFVRDVARGETVELDAIQGGSVGGGPEPVFQFASRDGSRVFFTDTQPLTEDSAAGVGKPDLFECQVVLVVNPGTGEQELKCDLTDLTPKDSSGRPAEVRGTVLGASEDGSSVYFVANGVLAPTAEPGHCVGPSSRQGAGCSLYLWHEGHTSLIATLSAEDYPSWAEAPEPLAHVTSRVSPNGRWVAFMSDRPLTGYDTRDATTGVPVEEVYLFDSTRPATPTAPGVAGNPVCVSCDPTGARPVGVPYEKVERGTDGGDKLWDNNRLLAGSVPGWTTVTIFASLHQPAYLTDSGRVFFNSSGPLVPSDVNATGDVYQYEPLNTISGAPAGDSCQEATATFNPQDGGCVGLISSGDSPHESGFLDASATGNDIFFFTTAKLNPADTDGARDVYDAHQCTTEAPCYPEPAVTPPPCKTADNCKAAPTPQPPIYANPASSTFTGPGNQTPPPPPKGRTAAQIRAEKLKIAVKLCRKKHNKHKRQTCEKAAHKAYGAKAATRRGRR